MFEAKQAITEAIDAVWQLIATKTRGDVLTYVEILRATGFDRESQSWNSFKARLRKRILRDFGIALRSIPNVGFRLLNNEQQVVDVATERLKKRDSQAKKAINEISAANVENLPMQLKVLKVRQLEQLENERKQYRSSKNDIKTVRTEFLPKRVIE